MAAAAFILLCLSRSFKTNPLGSGTAGFDYPAWAHTCGLAFKDTQTHRLWLACTGSDDSDPAGITGWDQQVREERSTTRNCQENETRRNTTRQTDSFNQEEPNIPPSQRSSPANVSSQTFFYCTAWWKLIDCIIALSNTEQLGFGKDAGKYMLFTAGENTSNNYTDLMWNNLTVLEWHSGASIKLRQSQVHWSLSFFREATQAVIGKAEGVSKMRKQKYLF